MKLPLWVYDYRTQRYIVFPHPEMFTTLSDGSIGFKFDSHLSNHAKTVVFMQYRHHFEANPVNWPAPNQHRVKNSLPIYEYRLKRQ